jgi:16S rRNA (cytosine967-C5)-methyltransferase
MSSSARAVALRAIARVIDEGAYSNRVVPALLARSALDERDRAFAAELAYGTLRRRLVLDRALDAVASRPVARMSPGVAHACRLGAYQLLEAGVPPHAAVGETVALVGGRERGFVNAVLRRLAGDPPSPPGGTSDPAVEGRTGLAAWAVAELRAVLGDDAEEAARALASPALLSLRAAGDVATLAHDLAALGREVTQGGIDPACLLVAGGNPATFPGFADGAFAVQDQASVLVVRALDPRPGDRVADVCAAPGGKAVFAASLVEPTGSVVAGDIHERRLAAVGRETARLGVSTARVVLDAAHPPLTSGSFDRVLVDAPCSGIGSARRRPELLWRVPAAEVGRLARRQLSIVTAAADLVRPGGRLVYSVCTFPRVETDSVVDLLLERRTELRPLATPGPDGAAERHRVWPHRHGADGMFIAAFERDP